MRKFVKADCSSWAFAKEMRDILRGGVGFVRVSRLVFRGGVLEQDDDEHGALRGVPLLGRRSEGAERALRFGHGVVPGMHGDFRVSKRLGR